MFKTCSAVADQALLRDLHCSVTFPSESRFLGFAAKIGLFISLLINMKGGRRFPWQPGPGAVGSPGSLLHLLVAQGTAGQRPPVLRALIGCAGRALIGCGEASRAGGYGGGGG